MQSVLGVITLTEMPVFAPNDYFWKHHWNKDKEEKWEAYARAVRTIIAKQGGFKELDIS